MFPSKSGTHTLFNQLSGINNYRVMESRQKPHMYKRQRKHKLLALGCQLYAYITSSFRLKKILKCLIFFAQGTQALTIKPESTEQLYVIFTAQKQYN
jgi:hypothetical protein